VLIASFFLQLFALVSEAVPNLFGIGTEAVEAQQHHEGE
jgi:hypothetical protein